MALYDAIGLSKFMCFQVGIWESTAHVSGLVNAPSGDAVLASPKTELRGVRFEQLEQRRLMFAL